MPKQIDNLEEKILSKGRELLISEGYSAFSMRRLAKECNIAVGTIYNYVENKDDLAFKIALSDWQKSVIVIKRKVKTASDLAEAMSITTKEIRKFRESFKDLFFSYSSQYDAREKLTSYHPQFRDEVIEFIKPLIPTSCPKRIIPILGELVLVCATKEGITEADIKVFIDLLKL